MEWNFIEPKKLSLQDMVQAIKQRIDVPFFIAGGSVFSTMNNTPYDDIDVFFYNEEDYLKVEKQYKDKNLIEYSTPNAITTRIEIDEHVKRLQFIRLNFGTPQEIFETFDLNCSMVAIDSEYNKHEHPMFSDIIKVNEKNFKSKTFSRYERYVNDKKAIDVDMQTKKNIISFLVKNIDTEFDQYYHGGGRKITRGYEILNSILYNNHKFENSISEAQYTHDIIEKNYKPIDRIEVFHKLFALSTNKINRKCDEMIVEEMIYHIDNKDYHAWQFNQEYSDEKLNNIKIKYAEYFI